MEELQSVPSAYCDDSIFGYVVTVCVWLCIIQPFFLIIAHQYRKHYKWLDEYPSKYIFLYNHIADLMIWISIIYWFYKLFAMKQHYDAYCILFNPIISEDNNIVSEPQKPVHFYEYCSIFDVTGSEYTHNPWPPYDKQYRIHSMIGEKYATIFMLVIYLGWQLIAQPLAYIIYTFCCEKAEVFEWILIECITVRSGVFFHLCCCWFIFYKSYFKQRYYFYQLSCYCCIHREFVPNVIILFSVGIHCIFLSYWIVMYQIIRAIDDSPIFKNQGVRDSEYYSVLILVIQQFVVQMIYLFPIHKYDKDKEHKRATLYLLHQMFTKDIANIISDFIYSIDYNETNGDQQQSQKIKLHIEATNKKM